MNWYIIDKQTTWCQNQFCDCDGSVWLSQNDSGCGKNCIFPKWNFELLGVANSNYFIVRLSLTN